MKCSVTRCKVIIRYASVILLLYLIITNDYCRSRSFVLPPPFPIIGCFGFSRYIYFSMHLDIHYVQIHSKNDVFRKFKTTYSLERREQQTTKCTTMQVNRLNSNSRVQCKGMHISKNYWHNVSQEQKNIQETIVRRRRRRRGPSRASTHSGYLQVTTRGKMCL